ncbi:MAG: hypothetical protein Q8N81_01585 [bacterium]|nr:hypothetical protein [bacterium]
MSSVDQKIAAIQDFKGEIGIAARELEKGIKAIEQGIVQKRHGIAQQRKENEEAAARFGAGVNAVKNKIKNQARENEAAAKKLEADARHLAQAGAEHMRTAIRTQEKETAEYIEEFYHGKKGHKPTKNAKTANDDE